MGKHIPVCSELNVDVWMVNCIEGLLGSVIDSVDTIQIPVGFQQIKNLGKSKY